VNDSHGLEEGLADAGAGPAGVEAALLDVRFAGYCVHCDTIVIREDDGTCPKGHPAAGIAGRVLVRAGDSPPRLPRFNVAAFLIPPVWGPAHGQWAGVIFLPMWLFLDNIVSTAPGKPAFVMVFAVFATVATLAAQAFFAKRANGLAWRDACAGQTVEEFARRQRIWAWSALPFAAVLVAWMVYFRLSHPIG
jgi:hypothetical protein